MAFFPSIDKPIIIRFFPTHNSDKQRRVDAIILIKWKKCIYTHIRNSASQSPRNNGHAHNMNQFSCIHAIDARDFVQSKYFVFAALLIVHVSGAWCNGIISWMYFFKNGSESTVSDCKSYPNYTVCTMSYDHVVYDTPISFMTRRKIEKSVQPRTIIVSVPLYFKQRLPCECLHIKFSLIVQATVLWIARLQWMC
jgi:hypothetical protein